MRKEGNRKKKLKKEEMKFTSNDTDSRHENGLPL
jgi:hypothetical protein